MPEQTEKSKLDIDAQLALEVRFWLEHTKPRGLTKELADNLQSWLKAKQL